MGRRIGRAITPNRRIGKRILREVEGVLDPQKRRDNDGDGMIFDGTIREMPAPTRGLRSTDVSQLPANISQTDRSSIGIVDEGSRPGINRTVVTTTLQGNRKKRLLQLLKINNQGAGKLEIWRWFKENLRGLSINDVLKNKKNKEKKILETLGVEKIKNIKDARKILESLYPHAATEREAYLRRDSSKKENFTFFEFLWYTPEGDKRDENSELSESELTLFLSHIRLLQQNQEIAERAVHYISGTMSYKANKSFVSKFIDAVINDEAILSEQDLRNLMSDFLNHQVHKNHTAVVPIIENNEFQLKTISDIDWGSYFLVLRNYAQQIAQNKSAVRDELIRKLGPELFDSNNNDSGVLGYVTAPIRKSSFIYGLTKEFMPSPRFMDKLINGGIPKQKKLIKMMYRTPEIDGTVQKNIVGTLPEANLTDSYFSMSSISNRILIARQMADLLDVANKKTLSEKISRITKQQEKIKESTAELSLNEEFSKLQKELNDIETELKNLSILTDELSEDVQSELSQISATTTVYHEGGHFLHRVVQSDDLLKKIREERPKRIAELIAITNPTPDEQLELRYLATPELEDEHLIPWLFKRLHLTASDDEVSARLEDTEAELSILGLTQIFANISTPLEINNLQNQNAQNVVIKNSILGLLIDSLVKNTKNRNPVIAQAAQQQLDEIVELHKHKLNEKILDPATNLPVQISESAIKAIVEKSTSAIKFLRDNPSIDDVSKIQERLKALTPTAGDLTLANLLKIVAIEQIIGQFGLDLATRMSGRPNEATGFYPQGLILGTDATLGMMTSTGEIAFGPFPGQRGEDFYYSAHLRDILPSIARYGLPKIFTEEENKSFSRSIRSYSLAHLGHYAEATGGIAKPLAEQSPTSNPNQNTVSLVSTRDTFAILQKTFKRLSGAILDNDENSKNHTLSKLLVAMPNLGMSNLASLINSNSKMKEKAQKGNFSEFYKLLDPSEKALIKKAIFDDSVSLLITDFFKNPIDGARWVDYQLQALMNLINDPSFGPVPSLSSQQINNIGNQLSMLAQQAADTNGVSIEAFQNRFFGIMDYILQSKIPDSNTRKAVIESVLGYHLGASLYTSMGLNLANHGVSNLFSWDDLSDVEIDTILNLVQRWGNEFGEPSYAMHDYRSATKGNLIGMMRLMTLGKRLEWAEIPAEINLIVETGIPFLTDGRNLTKEELNALTKLIRWMRPDEEKLPEIKSLEIEKENKWLI